jgi:tetratricopeptide (TPR) repeat protein
MRWFLAVIGVFLVGISVFGVWHGVRAWIAQYHYAQAKYGPYAGRTAPILELCQRAFTLYPWNYYFSILAAEQAYYTSGDVKGELRDERLRLARLWCDRGLTQNAWRSQLRRLHTRFLWERSPAEAIRYWKAHTAWQFWEPYNHAVLAEMYAQDGDFEEAEASLKWVAGDSSYERTRAFVSKEKAAWGAAPGGVP